MQSDENSKTISKIPISLSKKIYKNKIEPKSENSFSYIIENDKNENGENKIQTNINSFSIIDNIEIDKDLIKKKLEKNIDKNIEKDMKEDLVEIYSSNIDLDDLKEEKDENIIQTKENGLELIEKEPIFEIKTINLNKTDYLDNIFKCGINMKYISNKFHNSIKNKSKISLEQFKVFLVFGNGNCYYRCLSQFIYGKVEFQDCLRKAMAVFCNENAKEICNFQKSVQIHNGQNINTLDYINSMKELNIWATDLDILISSFVFRLNIAIYKYSEDNTNIEFVNSFIYEDNLNIPFMVLVNENLAHYNLIYPKREMIRINYKVNNSGLENAKIVKNNKFDDYNDFISRYNLEHKIIINPFPKYILGNDENLYLNMFNFLNNGVNQGKRTWPDYIEFIRDKKIQNIKKLEFYRKLGMVKDTKNNNIKLKINEENNKIGIFGLKDKYLIENGRLVIKRFCFNKQEKQIVYINYVIPYRKEIDTILIKGHDENNHPGLDGTLEAIKNMRYYWISVLGDANRYIKKCVHCENLRKQLLNQENYNSAETKASLD